MRFRGHPSAPNARASNRARAARAVAVLGFVWLLPVRIARADSGSVRVSYAGPAGCSSREAFVRELTRRTSRIRVSEAPDVAMSFAVEVADRRARVVGTLSLIDADGIETERAVNGTTCDEVVSALALIAAVLVDPEALTRQASTAAADAARASTPSWRFRPRVALGVGLSTAVGPGLPIGPLVELGLEAERNGARGPTLAIAALRLSSPTHTTDAGNADFAATFGRLTLCPLRWPATGPFFASACAAFEAGALRAAGSQTLGEQSVSVLWLAAAPAASFEYRPLRVLGVGLDVLAVFPLVRDHFYFGPDIPVFSVPVAGVAANLTLRGVWP
jgi:hypothetical protein